MPGRSVARCLMPIAVVCVLLARPAFGQPAPAADGIARLVGQIQEALAAGQPERYLQLLTPEADRHAATDAIASLLSPAPLRLVVREQDRQELNLARTRILVQIFSDCGLQARLATWQIDLRRSTTDVDAWLIYEQRPLTAINGLYKLSLNPSAAYSARGVSIDDEDFHLQMSEGSVFVTQAAGHTTGLVLVGKGEIRFRPSPATERGQMKFFAGAEEMQTPIDAAFVRLNPERLADRVHGLRDRQANLRDFKRAEEVFREHNGRAFSLDLGDFSPDTWSLLPREGDLLAELYTRRFGNLTYARAHDEPEDVMLFDRKARHSIAQYSSAERLAARGAFYDEDALAEYDVLDYDVDAAIDPEKGVMSGRTRVKLLVRADSLSNLTLRLAESLNVRSVSADGIGRLCAFRVRGRNAVVVTLPALVVRGTPMTVTVEYAGPIEADNPAAQPPSNDEDRGHVESERPVPVLHGSYVYSNRPAWYPQSLVTDYATATLRITVPERFSVLASGERVPPNPGDRDAASSAGAGMRRFAFRATRPVRYLACVVAPLTEIGRQAIVFPQPHAEAGTPPGQLELAVRAHPREKDAAREVGAVAADVIRFYAGLMGDCPYPNLDLAVLEQRLPGGHSPAYVTLINQPVPGSGVSWRNDPAQIDGFKEYFVAHEIAHQWWGQAVGWKNYHEQWLSEGFAQYFAALYAEHAHGPQLFQDILRRWQRWATAKSDQGPVYLGYRVGHLKDDGRVFRAVVYNKSATVLHMLRRLLGDEAFFRGLRRFYRDFRYRKAGTDDLQHALEAESGVSLQRFFEGWIYGDALPRVRATTVTDEEAGRECVVVRLEQAGQVFDMPIAVTIDYADRPAVDVTVRLDKARQEFAIPLAGAVRRVDLNRVDAVPFSDLEINAAATVAAAARPPFARHR